MKSLATVVALALCAGSALGGTAVVSQPPDIGAGGFFSDGVGGQFWDQLVGDNFTLSSGTGVTGVTWWGASEFFDFPDLTNMQSFQVEIFASSGGLPGASLLSLSIPTAATNPVVVGSGLNGENVYRHEISFGALNLPAGSYHLAIGATLFDGFSDGWVWNSSLAGFGDNIFGQVPFGSAWQSFAGFGDLAFEINAVPSPGAAGLGGLVGLSMLRRRR